MRTKQKGAAPKKDYMQRGKPVRRWRIEDHNVRVHERGNDCVVCVEIPFIKGYQVCAVYAMTADEWGDNVYRSFDPMGFLKPKTKTDENGGSGWALDDPKFTKDYPALSEYLFRSQDDEGKQRSLCRLTISFGDGMAKASLNDPGDETYTVVSGKSVWEALGALDENLQDGSALWQPSKWAKEKQKGKK